MENVTFADPLENVTAQVAGKDRGKATAAEKVSITGMAVEKAKNLGMGVQSLAAVLRPLNQKNRSLQHPEENVSQVECLLHH